MVGRSARRSLGLALFCMLAVSTASAWATDCTGALGTSRTLVVDPREHPRIGTMQYSETLPLNDREVVLTFDDGPLPHYTKQILDILDAECVKATFFIVGRMARAYPDNLRRVYKAGHTIGTHSQNHPLSFHKMSVEQATQEINDGIDATAAALGSRAAVAPFFRIPGLLRASGVEDYLASQGQQTWSADFPADDWRHISADQVAALALSRIEAKGKGILLLHDIQARTVGALPKILHELKSRGYRIVHVVPASPDLPKTPTQPQQWRMHPQADAVVAARWPAIPHFVFARSDKLPGPALSQSDFHDDALPSRPGRTAKPAAGAGPLPARVLWPRVSPNLAPVGAISLPVPAQDIFRIPDRAEATLTAPLRPVRRAERKPPVAAEVGSRPLTIGAVAARRPIAGSLPIRETALERGPIVAR